MTRVPISVSITIDKGLLEQVSIYGLKLISETLQWIVGNKSELAYWSQFDALLSHFGGNEKLELYADHEQHIYRIWIAGCEIAN